MSFSKPLATSDESGFEFVKKMLAGDPTYGINFDRVQWNSEENCWIMIEYLRCHKKQFSRGITPHTSHPNKYFPKNKMKFISLWKLRNSLKATFYLVNYSKLSEDEKTNQVKLMEVKNVSENGPDYVETIDKYMTRDSYSSWFREINKLGKI